MRILLISVALWIAVPTYVRAGEAETKLRALGDAYMQAYYKGDYDQLKPLYAENALFLDRTSEAFGPKNTLRFEGREAILNYITKTLVKGGYSDFNFEIQHAFVVGKRVVYMGILHYKAAGKAVGAPVDSVKLDNHIVSVLSFENNLVVEHLDFFDFQAYSEQVAKVRKQPKK